jgi:hypothetical protein
MDSFTQEDLPNRDPDTGNLTKAGYTPLIQLLTMYAALIKTVFHFTQSAHRMLSKHELTYTSWFPFDISVTTVYVIINTIHVSSTP